MRCAKMENQPTTNQNSFKQKVIIGASGFATDYTEVKQSSREIFFFNRRVSQRVSQSFLESKVYLFCGKGVCFAKYNYMSMFLVEKNASGFATD